jgi:hypothetical protein
VCDCSSGGDDEDGEEDVVGEDWGHVVMGGGVTK